MAFLDNLNNLLKSHNMTRSDLGRALDIPISTINSWYNRSSDGVALKTLVAIADYFNVSLDYLVNGEENNKEYSKKRNQTVYNLQKRKSYYKRIGNIEKMQSCQILIDIEKRKKEE